MSNNQHDNHPAPPVRDPVAHELDRARGREALFGRPFDPITIGRFTLIKHLGSGGMGEVFAAYDPKLDRQIAIKLVRGGGRSPMSCLPPATCPESLPTPWRGPMPRLLREAQTLARLSHPNVVQVYEAGEFRGRVYIAMEYVQGSDLRGWLEQRGRLGRRVRQREVLRLFLDIGRGLDAAHQAGLVHRDFKPRQRPGRRGRPAAGRGLRPGSTHGRALGRSGKRRHAARDRSRAGRAPTEGGRGPHHPRPPAGDAPVHGPRADARRARRQPQRSVQLLRGPARGPLPATPLCRRQLDGAAARRRGRRSGPASGRRQRHHAHPQGPGPRPGPGRRRTLCGHGGAVARPRGLAAPAPAPLAAPRSRRWPSWA